MRGRVCGARGGIEEKPILSGVCAVVHDQKQDYL